MGIWLQEANYIKNAGSGMVFLIIDHLSYMRLCDLCILAVMQLSNYAQLCHLPLRRYAVIPLRRSTQRTYMQQVLQQLHRPSRQAGCSPLHVGCFLFRLIQNILQLYKKWYRLLPEAYMHSRPINESAPWVVIASIISPLAPLPLRGFINATGSAPVNRVSKPSQAKNFSNPATMKSIAPDALKIPIATSIATRKGIIFIATPKPFFCAFNKSIIDIHFFNKGKHYEKDYY